jgi:hypothetical protein
MAAVPALPGLPHSVFSFRFCSFLFAFPSSHFYFAIFAWSLLATRTAARFRCSVRGSMMKEVSGDALGTMRGGAE